MKEFPRIPYLVSIYSLLAVNVLLLLKGELDAASCYEAMENWPMVSLPHGAAGAKKGSSKTNTFIQGYQEIVLSSTTMTQEEKPQRKQHQSTVR